MLDIVVYWMRLKIVPNYYVLMLLCVSIYVPFVAYLSAVTVSGLHEYHDVCNIHIYRVQVR